MLLTYNIISKHKNYFRLTYFFFIIYVLSTLIYAKTINKRKISDDISISDGHQFKQLQLDSKYEQN